MKYFVYRAIIKWELFKLPANKENNEKVEIIIIIPKKKNRQWK